MYRNAPEHPRIKEILRNGEISDGVYRRFDEENDCRDFELSDEEFTAVCVKRRTRSHSRQSPAKRVRK